MAVSHITSYPQLLNVLSERQKIVYLCGAGVSMSLGNHRLSWANWIRSGKSYLLGDTQAELDNRIGSWTSGELIDAATFLLSELKKTGKYAAFMDETIGKIHPVNQEFQDALRKIWRSGDLVATTNYDLSIEAAVGAQSVSYSSPAEILSVIRGEHPKEVIHLHGVYDKLNGQDDIVADDPQYSNILADAGAQFIQNLIGTHPLIVVGCGSTFEDPNLSGFMTFLTESLRVKNIPYFYLMRNGEPVPSLSPNGIPIYYGDDYHDLPKFLSELAVYRLQRHPGIRNVVATNPYITRKTVTSAFGRMHFTNTFNAFVGRDCERAELNSFLETDNLFSWWVVLGEGGIGKSRLVLEWLKSMPTQWYGFFSKKNAKLAAEFMPFTDTVIAFDYLLGDVAECAETIAAYLEIFAQTPYKLRIIMIERNQQNSDDDWLLQIKRGMPPNIRLDFEVGEYQKAPLILNELSDEDEITYVRQYLDGYLPILPDQTFADLCRSDIDGISVKIQNAFRQMVDASCHRPLFLSIFTEVWVSKEGSISLSSTEELLSEYLNKEIGRWDIIFGDKVLTESYIRLLAVACTVNVFNITDHYGEDYLREDSSRLIAFLDETSGKPGADNIFEDLFVKMDLPDEMDAEDDESFHYPDSTVTYYDKNNRKQIKQLDDQDRFAYRAPFIKLFADPNEVFLQMLIETDSAEDEEKAELERLRAEREEREASLPDHAWIIEPVFPDIIREYIVLYAANQRDAGKFAKLARSNSVLGLLHFLTLALEDWPHSDVFQRIATTPPSEVLNYSEYYFSLLIEIKNIENIQTVEKAMIESEPVFIKFEIELWRRIAVVLTDRNNAERIYESACNFVEHIGTISSYVDLPDSVADAVDAYSVGLHNVDAMSEHEAFLLKSEELARMLPGKVKISEAVCRGYTFLMNAKQYHHADIIPVWENIENIIRTCDYPEQLCKLAATCAHDYITALIGKDNVPRLKLLEEFLEEAFQRNKIAEIADVAALCTANIYTITRKNNKSANSDECIHKLKGYLDAFPESMLICSAFISVSRVIYVDTSSYRRVPDKLLDKAKAWALQYPEEIEFQEGYFGLLYSRLEYAREHDMRNEQRRLLREMKIVAERADYSEYHEGNNMLETLAWIQNFYGC